MSPKAWPFFSKQMAGYVLSFVPVARSLFKRRRRKRRRRRKVAGWAA